MEVCCLPGAWVKDIMRKLPSLVRLSDVYPLLLFHVSGDEATTLIPRAIKRDFRALGRLVREHRLFLPLSFQLRAASLEVTDRLSLFIYGSMAGVTATVLDVLIMGWPTWHQACWCQTGFTFLKEGKGSLITSWRGLLTEL